MDEYQDTENAGQATEPASGFDDAKFRRLRRAVRCSYDKLKPFREHRLAAIKQYVGNHYSENGTNTRVPLNLIEQAVSIYLRQLAARAPRALCTTRYPEIRPHAKLLEQAINRLIEEIQFEKTLKSAVVNAMFSVGIIKVGLEPAYEAEIDGVLHDIGQPYADNIDLDDFVYDTAARTWEQVQFCGNGYKVPLEFAKQCDLFDPEVRAQLKPSYGGGFEDETACEDKAENTGTGEKKESDDSYEQCVELWDIYLPRENKMLTISKAQSQLKPLREIEWHGPECGPYILLGFSEVPNNVMPLPPAALWQDMHELVNQLWRKLGRQALRQKTVTFVQKGQGEKDGTVVVNAEDGQAVGVDNPQNVREAKYGGPDNVNLAFALQAKDLFSSMAGNLEILGGLSPQSETLGQDNLLNANASKRISEMQDRTIQFAREVIRALAWYLWYDPLIELPLTKRVDGTDINVPVDFTPEDREGEYLDYNIDIQPYSMQDMTPSARLAAINQVLQTVGSLLPIMPMLQQSGYMLNVDALLRTYNKYANIPELEEIVTSLMLDMMPDQQPQPVGQPPTKMQPPVTTRRYERVNRPGATTQGKDAAMAQLLMGGNPQDSEKAAMMRPAS